MKGNVGNLKYHIGCSGFHYEEWKEKFYPPGLAKTKWFEYYNTVFNTVELNVTFYRTMKQSFFESLYSRCGDEFKFSVKASKIITHYKKFNEVTKNLVDFYDSVKNGLKEKLGYVLFQLPPHFTYSAERLEKIILALDPAFKNVVEFRHETWWTQKVYDLLEKHNICFCTVSYPGIPDPFVVNGTSVYIRLHGVPVLYRSAYPKEYLLKLAKHLKSPKIKEAYLYFDNTDRGAAIKNAQELKKMLGLL